MAGWTLRATRTETSNSKQASNNDGDASERVTIQKKSVCDRGKRDSDRKVKSRRGYRAAACPQGPRELTLPSGPPTMEAKPRTSSGGLLTLTVRHGEPEGVSGLLLSTV